MLEKTLESPLDSKEIKPVNPKEYQSWIFIGRTDAEVETPILWPPAMKNGLIGKDPNAGQDWRKEEKGTTEDKMVGWHHQLNGQRIWPSSRSWWWTPKSAVLQSMGLQRVGHDWVTQLNWTPKVPGTHHPLPCLQLLLLCQEHTILFTQLSQFCSTIHLHLGNSHVRKPNITNTNYILFPPNPAPSSVSHIPYQGLEEHVLPHSAHWLHHQITWIQSPKYCSHPFAAAAAKLLQSCPTLCDPIDGSPPGSSVPEILQPRILEWVAISFSNVWKLKSESEVAQLCLTLSDPMDLLLSIPMATTGD